MLRQSVMSSPRVSVSAAALTPRQRHRDQGHANPPMNGVAVTSGRAPWGSLRANHSATRVRALRLITAASCSSQGSEHHTVTLGPKPDLASRVDPGRSASALSTAPSLSSWVEKSLPTKVKKGAVEFDHTYSFVSMDRESAGQLETQASHCCRNILE